MGQMSQALALGALFEYQGQTYRVSPWTYRIMGDFELYLQNVAIKNCRRLRPILTEQEYEDLVHKTKKDLDIGTYTFGNPAVQEALQSAVHLRQLLLLCLQKNHPELKMEWIDKIAEEDTDKFQELMDKMNEANADPNVQTPEGTKTNIDSSATNEKT